MYTHTTHMHVHACTYMHARTRMHVHACTYTHARTRMHVHACTPHTHTHRHTRTPSWENLSNLATHAGLTECCGLFCTPGLLLAVVADFKRETFPFFPLNDLPHLFVWHRLLFRTTRGTLFFSVKCWGSPYFTYAANVVEH